MSSRVTEIMRSSWLFLLPLVLPLYVIRFRIGPLPTTLLEVFVVVAFAAWLATKIFNMKKDTLSEGVSTIKTNPMLRRWASPIVVWLLVTLVAVFVAQDKWGAFGHWRAFMLEPILVFVMLMNVSGVKTPSEGVSTRDVGRGTWDALLHGMATVCILLGAYAIFQYFTGWGIPHPWDVMPGRRATGIFGYPNGLSLFMAPFGIVCFMEWLKAVFEGKGWLPRLLFLFASAAALAAEITAKSIGGLAALGLGMVLVLLLNKKTRLIGIAGALLGLMAASILGYGILSTRLKSTGLDDSLYLTKRWSGMVRTVIWQESWQVITAHPLFGTGLRSYQTAVAPYHTATWMEIYPHPHNIILMLWIETGLMGLLAFIWLCTTWIRVISRQSSVDSHHISDIRQTTDDGRLTTVWLWLIPLIVILIHGMVDMPYFKNDLAMQFWILAALVAL